MTKYKLTFTAVAKSECECFFRIKTKDGDFKTIDEFVKENADLRRELLNDCIFNYRNREISFEDYCKEYATFAKSMKFLKFQKPMFPKLIPDFYIRSAAYFTQKAIECLDFARFFTTRSALLIDINQDWTQGYVPQFHFRCAYFGTSTIWFSNAFDHVIQSIYWGKKLYTSVTDNRLQKKLCNDSCGTEEILKKCSYKFVTDELKKRGLTECREHLTNCFSKIEEVRKWANYIKHKGGIDYKFLEPDFPGKVYLKPIENVQNCINEMKLHPINMDEKYELKEYKSPVKIDIDEQIQSLVDAHAAILQSINEAITDIDYETNSMEMEL